MTAIIPDIRAVREELGYSQFELASLVGISKRAIQSYEQGWRKPSEMVERQVLLMLIAHRRGSGLGNKRCWEVNNCSPNLRHKCVSYNTRQGHLCWFFTGTMCKGKPFANWSKKIAICLNCGFMEELMAASDSKSKSDG